jgi:hypothetical protein
MAHASRHSFHSFLCMRTEVSISRLILRSGPEGRVSKDGHCCKACNFEAP